MVGFGILRIQRNDTACHLPLNSRANFSVLNSPLVAWKFPFAEANVNICKDHLYAVQLSFLDATVPHFEENAHN